LSFFDRFARSHRRQYGACPFSLARFALPLPAWDRRIERDQRAGERAALALAARQDARPVVGAIGEADCGQRFQRFQRLTPPIRSARDADIGAILCRDAHG
jgi:hypothetical protein